jgi:hypothetical protein
MNGGSRELYTGVNALVAKFAAGMTASGERVVQTEQKRSGYKIGDRGPGGGVIFFAEGGMYMECSGEFGRATWSEAVKVGRSYKGGGYTDWHLPDRRELDLMYQNLRKRNLGGFSDTWYWSSSEGANDGAWAQSFGSGSQVNYGKGHAFSVRPVRAF